jgi:hypothetical protein
LGLVDGIGGEVEEGPKIREGGEGIRRDSYRVGLRLDLELEGTSPWNNVLKPIDFLGIMRAAK